MRKKAIILGMALVAAAIIFLVSNVEYEVKEETIDIKELVKDYSTSDMGEDSASITSHDLIVAKSDGSEHSYELPKDEFFVSIAPYINETHPCALHNLTGCQGEMANEEFAVYIEDKEGNAVVDEVMKSHDNGFIDLWIPRDQTYKISIAYKGKKADSTISSFKGDHTCITTMQLS
ncbi:CueP family metal-binding protein [Cytobacillus gottheilii]|uniref:CueP family metal-binding protein n=2 Tax=Cytobacillus gottheilii TaxID=859144 RepID=A0ABX8FCN5_9BACI|nr:CueP family metal-binding protein [Cytobacillus gottheilii]